MEETLPGMVTVAKSAQFSKALFPMDVTPSEMVTDVRLWQSRKASSSMDVALPGRVTDVKDQQPMKAFPMDVIPSGNTASVTFLPFK